MGRSYYTDDEQHIRCLQAGRALDERRIALLESALDVIRSTLKRAQDPVLWSKAKQRILADIDRLQIKQK